MGNLGGSNWRSAQSRVDNTEVFLHTHVSPETLQSRCQDVVSSWLMVQGAAGKVLSLKRWPGSL